MYYFNKNLFLLSLHVIFCLLIFHKNISQTHEFTIGGEDALKNYRIPNHLLMFSKGRKSRLMTIKTKIIHLPQSSWKHMFVVRVPYLP